MTSSGDGADAARAGTGARARPGAPPQARGPARARRVQVARGPPHARGATGRRSRHCRHRLDWKPRSGDGLGREQLGLHAIVYAPEAASREKLAIMERLGAEVRATGADLDQAKAEGPEFAAENDLPFLEDGAEQSQYEGYGSIAAEILEQALSAADRRPRAGGERRPARRDRHRALPDAPADARAIGVAAKEAPCHGRDLGRRRPGRVEPSATPSRTGWQCGLRSRSPSKSSARSQAECSPCRSERSREQSGRTTASGSAPRAPCGGHPGRAGPDRAARRPRGARRHREEHRRGAPPAGLNEPDSFPSDTRGRLQRPHPR